MVEGGTCKDTGKIRSTDANSHPGDGRGMHLSGHEKKQTDQRALTSWRWQRGPLVRTRKESDRATRTHILDTAEGGTCQDTERNRPTNAYSLPGDGRGRHLSGYGKNPTNRRALTSWGQQREAPVRAQKANRPTDAHSLSGNGRGRHL